MLRLFSILMIVFFIAPVYAQDNLTIKTILDANRVELSNGQIVMLGGVVAHEGAQDYLTNRFKGKSIQPFPEDSLKNRYGEVVAHLKTIEGIWIQKELVRNGLAHAFTMPSFREGQVALLAAEKDNGTLDANAPIDKMIKGFQVVEGIVVDAVESGKYVYLNFGDDYKTDFTISTKKKFHKSFLAEGFNILELKGKKVRMRGWMDHYNGPFIKLSYPEQIQIM